MLTVAEHLQHAMFISSGTISNMISGIEQTI